MNKKIQIFVPRQTLRIQMRSLILLLLTLFVVIIYSTKSFFPAHEENLGLLGFLFVIITFLYFLYYIISNIFIHEPVNGKLDGEFSIHPDKIICGTNVYQIQNIKKISIMDDFVKGAFNGQIRALSPKRSNGIKNYIEIFMLNGDYAKHFFLQTKSETIEVFIPELKTYFERGLIGEQNFENILNKHHR